MIVLKFFVTAPWDPQNGKTTFNIDNGTLLSVEYKSFKNYMIIPIL